MFTTGDLFARPEELSLWCLPAAATVMKKNRPLWKAVYGTERRWTYFFGRDTLEMPEDELLEYVRSFCKENPEREGFRHRGQILLYKEVDRWYHSGVKSAYTLEVYLTTNPYQYLHCYLSVYLERDGKEGRQVLIEEYIHTTEQLEAWMDRYKAYLSENKDLPHIEIYPCIKFAQNEPMHMPTRVSGPVVARYGRKGNSYVSSYEKGKQLRFSHDVREAVVFESVDKAYELLGNNWGKLYFVKADTPVKVKPFVLRLDGGKHSGSYVARMSASKLFTTTSCMAAMRFISPGEALRYAKRLREKGLYESLIGKFILRNLVDNTDSALEVY